MIQSAAKLVRIEMVNERGTIFRFLRNVRSIMAIERTKRPVATIETTLRKRRMLTAIKTRQAKAEIAM